MKRSDNFQPPISFLRYTEWMNTHSSLLSTEQILFSIPVEEARRLRQVAKVNPIIGQDRAINALELGLGIKADGYNIFIMGASGTGRRTVLTTLLANYKSNPDDLQDIAYVCNFHRPLEPKALFFRAGTGSEFKKSLQAAIDSIRRHALQVGKSEQYLASSKKILTAADAEENKLLEDFETLMGKEGFKLRQIKEDDNQSMDLIPIVKGKPVSFDELQERVSAGKFPADALGQKRDAYFSGLDKMSTLFATLKDKRRSTDKQLRALRAEAIAPIIDNELAALKARTIEAGNKTAVEHLDAVREDLLSRINALGEPFKSPTHKRTFQGRYEVNLLCDKTPGSNCVIQEEIPTFANLFGSIEATSPSEDLSVNGHLRLRAGTIHRAFGGFLVLRLQDVLLEEGAWPYLKRVLQSGKAEIQAPPTGNHIPSALKPQSLPIKMKAIVIGGEHSYDFLYQEDPDFQKLFKVCAEFDSVMPRTDENTAKLIAFIDDFTSRQALLPFDDSGIARVVAHAARISEYRNMLTTRFTLVSDLLQEADYHARKGGSSAITDRIVSKAIEERQYLQRLPEEKYADMIRDREIVLAVAGTAIGKTNGLAVQDRGYHAFGIPVAVTAQASPGHAGIINIERESGLSGEIYDKAHLIIQGLLHRKYARDIPLAISASICFEQSYTEVNGDSASCAEFYALLSAIAEIPLRQDIAITGSLNQMGDVQPVGGVPEKIEGFFDTCSILGLSSTQGVIIPRRNLNSLLPSDRVQKAVSEGLFHVWAIDTVEEGIEILSGINPTEFGRRVYDALNEYAARMKNYPK
jgi:lon-related putative ATP-dependent protease